MVMLFPLQLVSFIDLNFALQTLKLVYYSWQDSCICSHYERRPGVRSVFVHQCVNLQLSNLALPITIIVDNFIKVAQDEQQAEQFKEAEMELTRTISQEEQRRLIHKTSKANR